jgi:hypothetical protein
MRILACLLALFTLLPTESKAGFGGDISQQCKGAAPFKSPKEFYKGSDPDNPCQVQSSVFKNQVCRDTFNFLNESYDDLLRKWRSTCAKAKAAADLSQKNCAGQATCVKSQKDALLSYQAAIKDLISTIDKYYGHIEKSTDELMGNPRYVVGMMKSGSKYAETDPNGKSAQTMFIDSQKTNLDVKEMYLGGDPEKAEKIVSGIHDGSGSDISGIKSPLLREPLEVVQAAKDFNQNLEAYKKQLQRDARSIETQAAEVDKAGKSLNTVDNRNPENQKKQPADTPTKTASNNPESSLINAAQPAAPQAASSAGGASGGGAGGGAPADSSSPAPMGQMSEAGATAPTPKSNGQASKAMANASGSQSGDPQAGKGDTSIKNLAGNTPVPVSPGVNIGGIELADSGGPDRNASGASAYSATNGLRAAVSAKIKGGDSGAGASLGGPNAVPATAAARAPASAGGSSEATFAASSLGSFDSGSMPSLDSPAPAETNEKAVQGIVAEWNKALSPDAPAEAEQASEGDPRSTPEGVSLFLRIRNSHDRAMKRGAVLRGIPVPL